MITHYLDPSAALNVTVKHILHFSYFIEAEKGHSTSIMRQIVEKLLSSLEKMKTKNQIKLKFRVFGLLKPPLEIYEAAYQ